MKTLLLTATAVIAGQDFPLRLVLRGAIADRTRFEARAHKWARGQFADSVRMQYDMACGDHGPFVMISRTDTL